MSTDNPIRESMESPLEQAPDERPVLTLAELAYLAGTTPGVIEQLVEWDIMAPVSEEQEPCFHVETLPLVRKLLRFHAGLGIDFPSLPLVLDLLKRIADLEERLAQVERSNPR